MQRRHLAALSATLALLSSSATAETASPADQDLAASAVRWMGLVFAVPEAPDLDASLRDAMSSMSRQHLARLDKLVPQWIAEAHARTGTPATQAQVVQQTRNRLINEVALWRLESPGPAYDAVFLKAVLEPGVCNMPERGSYMGRLMTWLQAVPPADRAVVLSGEREMLAHWGRPRAGLPERPARSLAADEDDAIAHLVAGDGAPDVAMPPIVASVVFVAERQPMHANTSCALHQWGLARALARGDAPAAALAAWRYQMLMTAADWSDQRPQTAEEIKAANGWPQAATQSAVRAAIDVRVVTDAQGRFASGTVAARHVLVPGVADVHPVAFETLFDDASVTKAAAKFKPLPPADGQPSGSATVRINWSLE